MGIAIGDATRKNIITEITAVDMGMENAIKYAMGDIPTMRNLMEDIAIKACYLYAFAFK